jgi:hypothetical protein
MIELLLFILCMLGAISCLIGACYIAVIIGLCKFICPKRKRKTDNQNKPDTQEECCAYICGDRKEK